MKKLSKFLVLLLSSTMLTACNLSNLFGSGKVKEHEHIYTNVVGTNENYHIVACEICGETKQESHDFRKDGDSGEVWISDGGHIDGYKTVHSHCSVCGYEREEEVNAAVDKETRQQIYKGFLEKYPESAKITCNGSIIYYNGEWRSAENGGLAERLTYSWVKLKQLIASDEMEGFQNSTKYAIRSKAVKITHYNSYDDGKRETYQSDEYEIVLVMDKEYQIVSLSYFDDEYQGFVLDKSDYNSNVTKIRKFLSDGATAFATAKQTARSLVTRYNFVETSYRHFDDQLIDLSVVLVEWSSITK